MVNYTYSYGDPDAKPGDVIRFGQYITLTTLPNEGGKVKCPALDIHYNIYWEMIIAKYNYNFFHMLYYNVMWFV